MAKSHNLVQIKNFDEITLQVKTSGLQIKYKIDTKLMQGHSLLKFEQHIIKKMIMHLKASEPATQKANAKKMRINNSISKKAPSQ